MDYNDIIEDIVKQINQTDRSKAIEEETEQMTNDQLLNTIALEIKRQGG